MQIHGRFTFIGFFFKSRTITFDNGKLKDNISVTDELNNIHVYLRKCKF